MTRLSTTLAVAVCLCGLPAAGAFVLPSSSSLRPAVAGGRRSGGHVLAAAPWSSRTSGGGVRMMAAQGGGGKEGQGDVYAVPEFVEEANKKIVGSIKDALVAVYGDRHYARFHALETIARVPYFAYTSVLHLYETLGWRRRADLMKIHFAESWNELHHLLIMEELGGNAGWADRLVAVHLAFFYYWFAIALYMASPETAYNLNEQVERHAYDTYDRFLKEHEAELRAQPAPQVAKEYYETGDLYMFDEFHTTTPTERRRPRIETLYDVFVNVRNDEKEHFLTMAAMQRHAEPDVVSPNSVRPSSSSSSSTLPPSSSSPVWNTVKQQQKAEEE